MRRTPNVRLEKLVNENKEQIKKDKKSLQKVEQKVEEKHLSAQK
jgi:hypothetical protein